MGKRFPPRMMPRPTLSNSCNHSYSLAAVLTLRGGNSSCRGSLLRGGAAAADDGRRFETRGRRQQSLVALATSLNSGDLSDAQQAYSQLSPLQRFGNPNGSFARAMSEIALQSGDLPAAQQACHRWNVGALRLNGRTGQADPVRRQGPGPLLFLLMPLFDPISDHS
jgi:hypothetical protein